MRRTILQDMFHALPSMNEQIKCAMNQDITILFLAIPVANKSAVPKFFSPCVLNDLLCLTAWQPYALRCFIENLVNPL